ncbi:MAG TPA: trehalose-phosphatase [Sphingobium sp.]
MTLPDSLKLAQLPSPPSSLLQGASLFLDFDGTLVPLTDVPEAVEVDAELIGLLANARDALGGRLAIVSGRSVATLRELFGLGDFLLSGTHGLEFAEPGKAPRGPQRLKAVDEAEAIFADFIADRPGLLVERKTLSVGLHFRRAPECADACRALAEEVALATGLMIQPGKMLYELRPGGADKGTAVAELMKSAPMAGGMPIFVGDDLTDEEGMMAAQALGGCGILVGPARVTVAQWHLEQVGAVRHYLSQMP